MIAKTIPSSESVPRMTIIKDKFALGPLRTKNENTLAMNVRNEKIPNLFILFLPCLALYLCIYKKDESF